MESVSTDYLRAAFTAVEPEGGAESRSGARRLDGSAPAVLTVSTFVFRKVTFILWVWYGFGRRCLKYGGTDYFVGNLEH